MKKSMRLALTACIWLVFAAVAFLKNDTALGAAFLVMSQISIARCEFQEFVESLRPR